MVEIGAPLPTETASLSFMHVDARAFLFEGRVSRAQEPAVSTTRLFTAVVLRGVMKRDADIRESLYTIVVLSSGTNMSFRCALGQCSSLRSTARSLLKNTSGVVLR